MTSLLVVNQHGDNRGDEAAMRGMVDALQQRLPDAQITILHQFADPMSEVELSGVTYLPLRLPVVEAAGLAIWAVLRRVGIAGDRLLGPTARRTVAACAAADLAISAPGGPYFGDLYADHEAVHWFYLWLTRLHDLPLVLYQPSCGPFRNRLLNPLRRAGYRWFDDLTVRESISAELLERFTGRTPHLGSDSALHQDVPAGDVATLLGGALPQDDRPAIAATFRAPGDDRQAAHDTAIVDLLRHATRSGYRVVLLPQLHGPRHRDAPYLRELADRVGTDDVVVAQETLDSDEQRSLIAACELVIAGRYHPLVFAAAANVPAVTIPYEHKASGFARAAGLSDYVLEIDELTSSALIERFERLRSNLADVRNELGERLPDLRARADATADRACARMHTNLERT